MADLSKVELYAWLGEDDSGEIGIRRALVADGRLPMVAVHREWIDTNGLRHQLSDDARQRGKPIHRVRCAVTEVLDVVK